MAGKMEEINTSVGQLLFDSLQKYGDKVLQFIVETGEVNTYADMLSRSVRTALHLKKKGISRKDIISTCTHNHKDSWVPFIAAQLLGSISANYDPNLSQLDTVHLLKLVEPTIIFVDMESLNFMEKCIQESNIKTELVVFGKTKHYTQFSDYLESDDDEQNFIPEKIETDRDTALLSFTSGTTGFPKGVIRSHRCLSKKGLGIFVDDGSENIVNFEYHSMYWGASINRMLDSIYRGCVVVTSRKFDPVNVWELIKKYKISGFFMQPGYARDFLNSKPEDADTSSLSQISVGGWRVTKKLMEDMIVALPTVKILQRYGQTEGNRLAIAFDALKEYHVQIKKPTSCGRILPNNDWKIVDIITGERLGPNQNGELRIKSEYQMDGYYKIDSDSAFDSEGYLKSGDILYYDEEECFYVVDRVKEMFKYRAWHISPAVLEEVLESHPSVKEAVVLGIPAGDYGDHAMGLVTLVENPCSVTAEDIQNFVNNKVADCQQLRGGVRLIDSIPRYVTGKINRRILKDMYGLRN